MSLKTLAFFGATGDTAGHCLASSLKNGYDCIALARSPERLSASMTSKGVDQKVQDQHLTIIKGDVRDLEAVKRALAVNNKVVDTIISGVGCTSFKLVFTPYLFGLTDERVCRDAASTILTVLTQLAPTHKPLLVNVSTTGIPPPGKPRDIPLLWVPLYMWLLHSPHIDKAAMEAVVRKHLALPDAERSVRASVLVRPSLFAASPLGWEKLKVGNDEKPVRGYVTERRDVGEWMFEMLVKGEPEQEWINGGVHLTH